MHINLNRHSEFFASGEKPEEEKKPFSSSGKILQQPYLQDGHYILFVNFYNGGRKFCKVKSYSGRVGDLINISGHELKTGLIIGKQF